MSVGGGGGGGGSVALRQKCASGKTPDLVLSTSSTREDSNLPQHESNVDWNIKAPSN